MEETRKLTKTALLDENSTAGWEQDSRMKTALRDENWTAGWKLDCRMKKLDDCFEKKDRTGSESNGKKTLNFQHS